MNLLQSLLRRNVSSIQRYDGADFSGLDPLDFSWSFGGNSYVGMPGMAGNKAERIENNFLGMVQGAYKRNGVVFACMRARLSVFSEARFQFRRMRNGRPGDLFGTGALNLLEQPWPNGTTGDLLTRMLQDADLAGNGFWTVRNGYLRRMRPDWVTIVMGSYDDPDMLPDDLDAELLGYGYFPGGYMSNQQPHFLLPDQVAHFAPTPDPIAHYRGMSWITPIIRELQADTAATVHKLAFFENGATLQTIVSFKDMKQEVFEAFVKKMDLAHKGAQNAYKTLYLGGGADATVVGADLRQLDFKQTQGAGETRIAAAAGVPPAIVGLSEGLQGSSLNAGNLGQLRRQFAEGTLSTLWRNASASLATLVAVPSGAELWYDTRDIPFLREDRKDRADIAQQQAATLSSLINAGYTPDSAVAAIEAEDWTLLEHTGLFSVQLQPPGAGALPGSIEAGVKPPPPPASPANGNGKAPVAAVSGVPKARAAIAARAFNPDELREPHSGKWTSGGGEVVKDALKLAGRVNLDPGERLVSSSRFEDTSGAHADLLFAVIHGPYGNEVRIGVIPSEDAGKWTAEAKGATAGLTTDELRQARTDFASAAAAADEAAGEAEKARDSGHAPTDPVLLGAAPVASGKLVSANHDDLDWKIYLNDQAAWDLSITPAGGEFDGAVFDPLDTEALLKHLDELQRQLR